MTWSEIVTRFTRQNHRCLYSHSLRLRGQAPWCNQILSELQGHSQRRVKCRLTTRFRHKLTKGCKQCHLYKARLLKTTERCRALISRWHTSNKRWLLRCSKTRERFRQSLSTPISERAHTSIRNLGKEGRRSMTKLAALEIIRTQRQTKCFISQGISLQLIPESIRDQSLPRRVQYRISLSTMPVRKRRTEFSEFHRLSLS